ncbi:flagellar hook protein FlgE [Polymorphum gilvum]|uniref:Flagellar hook protein FlgE n=1 Tax=Polymorphum gilvum (strain LMG 25793 / CGMCC 1.9160 / SL003B-26A1) TaxID=991905 RepID=F2J3U2_POLGS|nr:flagellar hook-basal body complex protein [Polymorphum gilvum]ADZ68924.1 Flagellar hook-basal body protein [Polymorphum gilvum SL003B-26A1]
MSLFGALSTGVSGVIAQGSSLSTISNNISNLNTPGYKGSRTLFSHMVTGGGRPGTPVSGSVASLDQRDLTAQGAIINTSRPADLALVGKGFFVVTDSPFVGPETSYFYQRTSSFSENTQGYLVSSQGLHLQGWRTDASGEIINPASVESIELQSSRIEATATRELKMGINLTPVEGVYALETGSTLLSQLETIAGDLNTADYSVATSLFDAQGNRRDVDVFFMKAGANSWRWAMSTNGANIFGGSAGSPEIIGSGDLRFNDDGSLKSYTGSNLDIAWTGGVPVGDISVNFGSATGGADFDPASITGDLEFSDGIIDLTLNDRHSNAPAVLAGSYTVEAMGANVLQITEPDGSTFTATVPADAAIRQITFGNGVTMTLSPQWTYPAAGLLGTIDATVVEPSGNGSGADGIVQYASTYNTFNILQDGLAPGVLREFSIDEQGFVIGSYTNGGTRKLWKVAVAIFQDPNGLELVSGGLLREAEQSGRPFFREAGTSGTATIAPSSIEQSNVDIGTEFSNMIVSQRSYSASTKVITTVDQMLNELMNIR